MSEISRVSNQFVLSVLAREHGVSIPVENGILREVVLLEIVRSNLYNLSMEVGHFEQLDYLKPVYIMRLINTSSRQLQAVWPELRIEREYFTTLVKNRDDKLVSRLVRWSLELLQTLGECVNISNGYWLPTPIRLVRLPKQTAPLVVGGIGTNQLKKIFPKVQTRGLGRFFNVSVQESTVLSVQSFLDWVGWLPENLVEWTQKYLNRVTKEGSESSSDFQNFSAYLILKGNRLNKKSVNSQQLSEIQEKSMIQLCRSLDGNSRAYYFLGLFRSGQLQRELRIKERDHVDWLRLGLHIVGGVEMEATFLGEELTLFPKLPKSYERQLLLCVKKRYLDDKRKSVYFVIPSEREPARKFLSGIGYKIVVKETKK